jgi:hypothetical protein
MEDKNKRRIRTSNQEKKYSKVHKITNITLGSTCNQNGYNKNSKKLTEWEPCSSRPVGRPRLRWVNQVEEDLKRMKVRNWREKCKDRSSWNKIVKQAKTYQGL